MRVTLRRPPIALAIALLSVFAAAVAAGQTRSDLITTSEIHAGMTGYGLTVMQGEVPERFGVTVIDVLHNFRPDQDLILIRADHPILDHACTVAGMSGSPIFIDGRLAGAYAYGWTFGRDPVAGVTPIENMMAELTRPLRALNGALAPTGVPTHVAPAAAPHASLPPFLGETRPTAFSALDEQAARAIPARSPAGVRLASTPVMLGGLTDATANMLAEKLETIGLLALQAGGSESTRAPPPATRPHFVDGGAIGVELLRGDISAVAVGTITHTVGDRAVAFGHPMLNAGQLALPTATARVLHVLASEERSFKIAEAVTPLGTLVNDRQSAVVIDTAHDASLVPVTIRLHGIEGARRTEWHVEVASHRVLTPALVLAAVSNALGATVSDQTDVTFEAQSTIDIEGIGPITVHDIGFAPLGLGDAGPIAHLRVFPLLEATYGNPFTESHARSIEVDVTVHFTRDVFAIVDARVSADEVNPGAQIPVQVVVRPYNGVEQTHIVEVTIPPEAAGQAIEIAIEPGDDVALEQPVPRSLSDLVEIVRAGYSSTQLVASVRMPSRGLRLSGYVVRALPGSALDTLQPANASFAPPAFTTQARQVADFGHVLTGAARVRLNVRRVPRD